MVEYKIENVVVTVDFQKPVNEDLLYQLGIVEKKKRFPGYIIRRKETSFLMFSNGKAVIPGLKSEEEIRKLVIEIAKKISSKKVKVQVQNIVVTFDFGKEIDLESLALRYSSNSLYNPETFPGLILFLPKTGATALVFANGRIVIVGIRSMDKIDEAVREVKEILSNY